MIADAVSKALAQMGDPRFRGVLLTGISLAAALLAGAAVLVIWGLNLVLGDSVTLPFIGELRWLDEALSWGLVPLLLVASVLLMVPVASAITSLLLGRVAQAVEDRHYPHLPPAREASLAEGIADSAGFLAVLIGANLLALLLYLIFAPFAPFIFYGLNGLLLGREYFQMAALRRSSPAEARALRTRYRGVIWLTGILMALPLTIPVVNLVVPVLGAAVFTHLFHSLSGRAAPRV